MSSKAAQSTLPSVESFSIDLENFDSALHAEHPARWVEAQLLSRLKSPVRLLRWAIVNVITDDDGQTHFSCEGAYLRRGKQPTQN